MGVAEETLEIGETLLAIGKRLIPEVLGDAARGLGAPLVDVGRQMFRMSVRVLSVDPPSRSATDSENVHEVRPLTRCLHADQCAPVTEPN